MVLSVLNPCVNNENGPELWAAYSAWEEKQSTATASEQADADAAVAEELAKQTPKPVRCISKTTLKKKNFAGNWAKRQKCPKGWVKIRTTGRGLHDSLTDCRGRRLTYLSVGRAPRDWRRLGHNVGRPM